jgi:hypothetical protein
MANESNYSLKEVAFIKETTPGVFQTTPKLYKLGVMGFALAPTQKTEQNTELGQDGQATAMDTGSLDFAGNLNMKSKTGLMPILLHSVVGKSTKVDATTDDWTAATVYIGPADKYSAGQMVNHSDGLHTLVVKSVTGAGTSGAVEPDISGLNEYDSIVDNEVTWIVRKKLYKHTGTSDIDMQSLGVYAKSNTAQGGGVNFEQYFTGIFLNSISFAKASGTIVYKQDVPTVGLNYRDNTQLDWEALVPSGTVEIEDKSFSFNDMKVTIAGVEPEKASEFNLTLNRNVTVEDEVKQGSKDYNVPVMTMDGNLKLKFTKEKWAEVYDNPTKELVITYANRSGDKISLTFPNVKTMLGTKETTTDKYDYIIVPLSASGSATQKTLSYETITSTDW